MKNDGWVGSQKMKKVELQGDRGVGKIHGKNMLFLVKKGGWVNFTAMQLFSAYGLQLFSWPPLSRKEKIYR